MRVRTPRRDYDGDVLRREVDVFEMKDAQHDSATWMEEVAPAPPEHRTSSRRFGSPPSGRLEPVTGEGRDVLVERDPSRLRRRWPQTW